jgi:Spy/CpxP family protein refolding chaperone
MIAIRSIALALALAAPSVSAQGQPGGGGRKLEERVRQRIAAEVKTRLQLTDDQFAKLSATNRKFDEERRQLLVQERDIRQGLRAEVEKGNGADQKRVSELIDRALGVQRRRVELTTREQQELAGYLTPVQRAKYLGLQQAVRRRMEEMRRRRSERIGGGRPQRPPPRTPPR